jgi:hypothetical protein
MGNGSDFVALRAIVVLPVEEGAFSPCCRKSQSGL